MYSNETKPDFNFFLPINVKDFEKASKEVDGKRYDSMTIEGIASDASEDSDEEILEPKGFILDRFLKLGVLNYDHKLKDDPKFLIGEPLEAEIKDNKFYVKAKLYKESETARNLYDTMIMLKKSGSTRKLGFSIEGKALTRHPQNSKRITSALITGLAATFAPKNINSFADIVKGEYSEPIKSYKFDEDSILEANGGSQEFLVDIIDNEKGIRYTIDKNLCLKVEKAMDMVNSKPTIKESLEGKKRHIINVTDALFKGEISRELFNKANRNYNILVVWENIKSGVLKNNILSKIL